MKNEITIAQFFLRNLERELRSERYLRVVIHSLHTPDPQVVHTFIYPVSTEHQGMAKKSQEIIEYLEQAKAVAKAKVFLAREFLTWLWYAIDESDGHFTIVVGKKTLQVRAWIDDRVVLISSSADLSVSTLKGGDPARSLEADASLQSGKTVKEFKIGMEIDGLGPFMATLGIDAQSSLCPKSLQLPKDLPEEPNTEEPLALRLQLIEQFSEALDGLFLRFMAARQSASWEKTDVQKMQRWMKNRRIDTPAEIH